MNLPRFAPAGFFTLASALLAQQPFVPAPNGCAMAHCDTRISGLVRLNPPTAAGTRILEHDKLPAGKFIGLGCSSNGTLVACSYRDPEGNNLVAYDSSGARLWSSGSLLDANAYASAPMIDASGNVVAADDQRLIRFNSSGAVMWNTATPGGIAISPIVTQAGVIVLATKGGPVSAFGSGDGHLVGSLSIPAPAGSGFLETLNTPCVRGNRIYISTQSSDKSTNLGELVAVDVDPTNIQTPLKVAWQFTFGSPSGASPLCLGNSIYFDGSSVIPGGPRQPTLFGVRDTGTSPALLWSQPVPNSVPAALAQDPRGGFWSMYLNYPSVERRDPATGAFLEAIDVSGLIGGSNANNPFSAINLSGAATAPVMVLGATSALHGGLAVSPIPAAPTTAYVLAIDLSTRSLLGKVNLGSDSASSQFPIVLTPGHKPRIAFAGNNSGVYFVGAP